MSEYQSTQPRLTPDIPVDGPTHDTRVLEHAKGVSDNAGDFIAEVNTELGDEIFVNKRQNGIASNQLGLGNVTGEGLDVEQQAILADAKRIEDERGGAGMNPEAVKFVWASGNLCLTALARVTDNDRAWRTQKPASRPNGW